MTIVAGTKFGRYEIRSKIGEGGMGEVYLAQDTKLDRKVALKILPADVASHRDRMSRFVQEAKTASALNHPNIITIYEIERIDSVNFIATEFIEGETLRSRMRSAPLTLAEVLDVAAQIASALSAAHEAGIIHRDIKPDNIMLRRDGIVKVVDFGLAKLSETVDPGQGLNAEAATKVLLKTEPGVVMGTAAYMSPEQARGKGVDARTDIFSLGAVIYEMLSGRAPFAGETAADIIGALIHKEPQPLSTFVSNTPAELQHIVSKTLRKDCDERYQTARSLLVDLKTLKEELDFSAKLGRSVSPESRDAATKDSAPLATANVTAENADTKALSARPSSSAEYLVGHIKQHQRAFAVALAVLLLAAIGFGYWRYTKSSANAAAIESLAVMPFTNASGNSDIEYLSDGLTESLITSLSQLPKLSVKARSSVFRYKGKDVPPPQVGKELNVQAVLNGRLVQRGNDLTLHIELVDVNTETALWSGDYNRSMTNFVSLPSEIARDVSSKLRLKLSSPDEQKLLKNYPVDPEAYKLYLNGRYHLTKLVLSDAEKAVSYFQQAIAIDPTYALAYVGLADAYRAHSLSTGELPSKEFLPRAKAAAQKAIEIDDTLAEAHASLGGMMFWYDWDWNGAEKQCQRALELNPNSSDAQQVYANLLSFTGRHAEALAEAKRARELDPFNLRVNALEVQYLIHAGQVDEALARFQKTLELDPNFWFTHLFASSAYIEKGMFSEAVAEARKAKARQGVSSHATSYLGYALARSGKQAEARTELGALLKLSNDPYVPPYYIALIYNGLGERDEALAWLERGFEQRDARMVFLKVDPKWNNLRPDPRFQDLLRRVGF